MNSPGAAYGESRCSCRVARQLRNHAQGAMAQTTGTNFLSGSRELTWKQRPARLKIRESETGPQMLHGCPDPRRESGQCKGRSFCTALPGLGKHRNCTPSQTSRHGRFAGNSDTRSERRNKNRGSCKRGHRCRVQRRAQGSYQSSFMRLQETRSKSGVREIQPRLSSPARPSFPNLSTHRHEPKSGRSGGGCGYEMALE